MKKPPAKRPTPPRRGPAQPAPPSPQPGHMVEQRRETTWSGPLPPPAVLEQFNSVVENGAERIFQAWESETRHRHQLEQRDFRWSVFDSIFGKTLAFLFVLAALAVSVYALSTGATWFAGIIGGATIASVVWAFTKTNRTK